MFVDNERKKKCRICVRGNFKASWTNEPSQVTYIYNLFTLRNYLIFVKVILPSTGCSEAVSLTQKIHGH